MKLKKIISNLALRKELLAYIAVGLLGVFVDFGGFYLSLYFKMPILVSQWIGALLGFSHNHIWQHYKVFNHNQNFKKTYIVSLVISIISILVSGPFLLFLNKYIPILWFNKVVILGLSFVVLYIIKKKWIFIIVEKNME